MGTVTQPAPSAAPPSPGLGRRLVGATFNYGLGSVLPQVVGFFLIPVYTAFLSPSDYGVMELAASLGAFLAVAMRLGVPGAVTRFYFDYREGPELRKYVSTVATFLVASSFVVGLVTVAALYGWIDVLLPGLDFFPYAVLVVLSAVFVCNTELQRRLVQAREQSAYSAKLSIATSMGLIALALLFVTVFRWGVFGVLFAGLIVNVLFFMQALHYLAPDLRGGFDRGALRGSLVYGVAAIPSDFMGTLVPLFARSFLSGASAVADVGLLSLATRFTSPLNLLATAFGSAFLPVYMSVRQKEASAGLVRLADTERWVWLLTVFGSVAAAVLGPPAITIMADARFHEASALVPILTLGFVAQILYLFFGCEIAYSKKTWQFAWVTGAAAVVNVAVTTLTVPSMGPYGVAWASVAGSMASAVVAGILSVRLVRMPHDWTSLARTAVCGLAAVLLARLARGHGVWVELAAGVGALVFLALALLLLGDKTVRRFLSR